MVLLVNISFKFYATQKFSNIPQFGTSEDLDLVSDIDYVGVDTLLLPVVSS